MSPHSSSEADRFDEEFARLIEQNERCPWCGATPTEVGSVGASENDLLYAKCENGHIFVHEIEEEMM